MNNHIRSVLLCACLMVFLAPLALVRCTNGTVGNNNNTPADQCLCMNQDDVVQDKSCVRGGYSCDALNPCDVDYHCDDSNRCVCEIPDVCGIRCSAQCGCPTETVCDLSTSICREPMSCLDDSMCADGQLCQDVEIFEYRCTTPSGAEIGESCNESWDCLTGICHTGICLQPCESNSSCPVGQFCSAVVDRKAACVVNTACPNCTAPNQVCNWANLCVESCRTSADCPDNCTVWLGWPLYGECDDASGGNCGDDEFIVDHGPWISFCVIYQACWTQADCPPDYQCYTSSEMYDSIPANPSFCARAM